MALNTKQFKAYNKFVEFLKKTNSSTITNDDNIVINRTLRLNFVASVTAIAKSNDKDLKNALLRMSNHGYSDLDIINSFTTIISDSDMVMFEVYSEVVDFINEVL